MSFIGARVALKASNGKYLSIDGRGGLKLKDCSDDFGPEITFFVPLAVDKVFVQTHTREYVSLRDTGELELTPNSNTIGHTEAFDFICVGANRVAIKGHTGKYLGLHGAQNDLLRAVSDDIGADQTFEVIPIFR